MANGTKGKRGRKIQGDSYRDHSIMIRFNKQELEILESVTKSLGLDRANAIRSLLLKEYKKIQRDRASQRNMFEDK